MEETLELRFDADVRHAIVAELGSMNAFYGRLESLVARESGGKASFSESSGEAVEASNTRGGEMVEIATAVSGLIASLSPIVIAWIRSRGFEVEEKQETRKSGAVVRTVRIRQGIIR
jgi:hypothetical protein